MNTIQVAYEITGLGKIMTKNQIKLSDTILVDWRFRKRN